MAPGDGRPGPHPQEGGRLVSSDEEFAEYVISLPRVLSAEEVEALERVRTQRHGEYLNHHLSVHHCLESRH